MSEWRQYRFVDRLAGWRAWVKEKLRGELGANRSAGLVWEQARAYGGPRPGGTGGEHGMKQGGHAMKRGAVAVPAAAIALMAVGLAVGLTAMGLLRPADAWARKCLAAMEEGGALREVPLPVVLAACLLGVWVLLFGIFDSPGWWRRVVLWVTAMVLALAAVPVMALAGWWLAPAVPVVVMVWSGLGAATYVSRHAMPCDLAAGHERNPGPGTDAGKL